MGRCHPGVRSHFLVNVIGLVYRGCPSPPQSIRLDRQIALADREGMIRVSAAQYFWFSYAINPAEQGTRAI